MTLTQDLRKLKKLKQTAAQAEEKAEAAKQEFREWERHCLNRMEGEDVEAHKALGTNFVRVETIYAQIQDREAFVRWAEENDDSLVEARERKAVLAQLVREKLDNGEVLPPGVGFYVKEYISQRAG